MKFKDILRITFSFLFVLLLYLSSSCAQPVQKQFTFSWQFDEESMLKPRGGNTKGAPARLDHSPNEGFLSIREKGISKFEKDRRAILSMAGTYRTSFNFIETASFKEGYKVDRPYQSWATEYIEVVEDSGTSITLQHILVMYFINEDGEKIGPFTSKHWRQDWKFEDTILLEYKGHSTWEKSILDSEIVKGKWTQAVYQVDDSPRYEGIGIWEHKGNFSGWTSSEVWRPLPRREFSVRNDYDVLSGTNMHIITPDGWIHEQHNLKLALNENGNPLEENPYISREIGVNRYERIIDGEYEDGKNYMQATGKFWKIVRDRWNEIISENQSITFKKEFKEKKLFEYLFPYAENIVTTNSFNESEAKNFVDKTIDKFVISSKGNDIQIKDSY